MHGRLATAGGRRQTSHPAWLRWRYRAIVAFSMKKVHADHDSPSADGVGGTMSSTRASLFSLLKSQHSGRAATRLLYRYLHPPHTSLTLYRFLNESNAFSIRGKTQRTASCPPAVVSMIPCYKGTAGIGRSETHHKKFTTARGRISQLRSEVQCSDSQGAIEGLHGTPDDV